MNRTYFYPKIRGNLVNKKNSAVNLRFVVKTSDIINVSENIRSDVKTSEVVLCWLSPKLTRPLKTLVIQQRSCHVT